MVPATDHLRQVAGFLLVTPVVQHGIDGTLGEQRAQREGHVCTRQHLLQGEGDDRGESTTAELLREGQGGPTRVDELFVRGFEGSRGGDGGIRIAHRAHGVADVVRGCHDVGDEGSRLGEQSGDGVEIGMLETG
jgi:hypothetical protein